MLGTGPFAVPTLAALYGTRHDVAALVTQPARGGPAGPGNPVRLLAEQQETPVLAPENVNEAAARDELAALQPDLLVVADYGQILSPETLGVARLGGVNLHGSLLPRYRGAAPINWAIWHGETETGVTVIHMTPRIDAGPILAQAGTAIGADEDAVALETRLAELGAPLVCQAIDDLAAGRAVVHPQDPSRATPARRLRKSDGLIDWSRSAAAILNQVRALKPWPGTYTFWQRSGAAPMRLIVEQAAVAALPANAGEVSHGAVIEAQGDRLVVAAGEGGVRIERLQPAGKRPMSAAEFLRGHGVRPGDRFVGQDS